MCSTLPFKPLDIDQIIISIIMIILILIIIKNVKTQYISGLEFPDVIHTSISSSTTDIERSVRVPVNLKFLSWHAALLSLHPLIPSGHAEP